MDFAIYGAQGIALGAYDAIRSLMFSKKRRFRGFLVTELGANAQSLSGIPVYDLETFSKSLSGKEKEKIEVLIATPENVMKELEKNLNGYGFFHHVRLTSSRWTKLMEYYYVRNHGYIPLSALPIGCQKANIHMYMAKFYKDKPLVNEYSRPEWVVPIQVGAALCGERVADVLDCQGENISAKNVNYSELTALYWIWKNQLSHSSPDEECEYYGLAHYRRLLELTEDDTLRLLNNAVDVVLPYPMPYEPDIEAHHKRYLKKEDWNAVLAALSELHPLYAEAFPNIFKQRYFYNYNIILARKQILDKYCNWLFPILERVEELTVPRGWDRSDRYVGYIGESLLTLYYIFHKDDINIVHTGCRFLI